MTSYNAPLSFRNDTTNVHSDPSQMLPLRNQAATLSPPSFHQKTPVESFYPPPFLEPGSAVRIISFLCFFFLFLFLISPACVAFSRALNLALSFAAAGFG